MERAQIQLVLLEEPRDWRIDDHTKEIGREGIADARASIRRALQEADREERQERHARQERREHAAEQRSAA